MGQEGGAAPEGLEIPGPDALLEIIALSPDSGSSNLAREVSITACNDREIMFPAELSGGPVVGLKDTAGVESLDTVDLPDVFGLRVKRRRAQLVERVREDDEAALVPDRRNDILEVPGSDFFREKEADDFTPVRHNLGSDDDPEVIGLELFCPDAPGDGIVIRDRNPVEPFFDRGLHNLLWLHVSAPPGVA